MTQQNSSGANVPARTSGRPEFDPRDSFFPPFLEAETEPLLALPPPRRTFNWRLVALPVVLLIGAGIGYWFAQRAPAPAPAQSASAPASREAGPAVTHLPASHPQAAAVPTAPVAAAATSAPAQATAPPPEPASAAAAAPPAPAPPRNAASASGRVSRAGSAAIPRSSANGSRVTHTRSGAAPEAQVNPPRAEPAPAVSAAAAGAAPAANNDGGATQRPSAVICTEQLAALGLCARK
jgi:hypothetical protein